MAEQGAGAQCWDGQETLRRGAAAGQGEQEGEQEGAPILLRKYDRRDKLEDGMPPAAAGGGGDKGTLITARIAQAGSVATG